MLSNKIKRGTFYINCYNIETNKRKHFKVPESIYIYIKQLEAKLKYPNDSKLFSLYPMLKNKKVDYKKRSN